MKHFIQVGTWDIVPLLLQLARHPELWDQNNDRTTRNVTAHRETSDIWLRYRPIEQLLLPADYNERFAEMQWYPALQALPEVRNLCQALMVRVNGTALGGVLITGIPAGGKVAWHSDKAAWHARYYDTKVYTVLKANAQCRNFVADESLVMRAGECWVFDNLKPHAVVNDGDDDRITLITSIRCD